MEKPEAKWYIVIPLSLMVMGGFVFLAWVQTGGQLPEFSFSSKPTFTEEELENSNSIELVPDEPTSTELTARELKALRAEQAIREKQLQSSSAVASATSTASSSTTLPPATTTATTSEVVDESII